MFVALILLREISVSLAATPVLSVSDRRLGSVALHKNSLISARRQVLFDIAMQYTGRSAAITGETHGGEG
jgi:hypothetical protein